MATYEQTIKIDFETAKQLTYWLNNNQEDNKLTLDMTYAKTAHFPDGFEMDIKCCGSDDGEACTEAVLFDTDGYQCCFTDVSDEFLGDWELDWNGTTYIVHVIPDLDNNK